MTTTRHQLISEAQIAAEWPSYMDRAKEHLMVAVEGECDGLAIDDKQAQSILDYVFTETFGRPPAPNPAPVAEDCEYCADGLQADGETPCTACKQVMPVAVERRLAALEKWAHEPFDFGHLIARLDALEAAIPTAEGR